MENSKEESKIVQEEKVRKMCTEDTLMEVIACFGICKNYQYVSDCVQNKAVMDLVKYTQEEVSRAVAKEYNFSMEEMNSWNKKAMEKISEPFLKSELRGLGGNTNTKLKKDGRLVAPAIICINNGMMPYYLAKAIANVFSFLDAEDQLSIQIVDYLSKNDIKSAIRHFCGLDKEKELIQLIADHYNKANSEVDITEEYEKVAIIKKAYELGFEYELTIKGCAQCTLAALFDVTGKPQDILFQAAGGLAGGMALSGDGSCGGYTGGIMLMGSFIGRRLDRIPVDGDKAFKYKSYEMAQRLHDRFIETYGSVICRDIHKEIFGKSYCIRNKEESKEFELAGAHTTKCTTVVGNACAWIAEILIDENLIAH